MTIRNLIARGIVLNCVFSASCIAMPTGQLPTTSISRYAEYLHRRLQIVENHCTSTQQELARIVESINNFCAHAIQQQAYKGLLLYCMSAMVTEPGLGNFLCTKMHPDYSYCCLINNPVTDAVVLETVGGAGSYLLHKTTGMNKRTANAFTWGARVSMHLGYGHGDISTKIATLATSYTIGHMKEYLWNLWSKKSQKTKDRLVETSS